MTHVERDKTWSRKVSLDVFSSKQQRVTKATKTILATKLRTCNVEK
jgi:hypothetical protein